MKLIIFGHQRHGKDEALYGLATNTSIRYRQESDHATAIGQL